MARMRRREPERLRSAYMRQDHANSDRALQQQGLTIVQHGKRHDEGLGRKSEREVMGDALAVLVAMHHNTAARNNRAPLAEPILRFEQRAHRRVASMREELVSRGYGERDVGRVLREVDTLAKKQGRRLAMAEEQGRT